MGNVQVAGSLFEPQQYGIAFPSRSQAREPVNRALLEIMEDGYVRPHLRSVVHCPTGVTAFAPDGPSRNLAPRISAIRQRSAM